MQTVKQVKIGDQQFQISYPTVGQKLQIENVKLLLTDNNYGDLARSGHISAIQLLDLVDAVAYFTILIPEISKSLNVQDFLNMEPKKTKMYIKAFKEEFMPWMDKIDIELNREDDGTDEEEIIKV